MPSCRPMSGARSRRLLFALAILALVGSNLRMEGDDSPAANDGARVEVNGGPRPRARKKSAPIEIDLGDSKDATVDAKPARKKMRPGRDRSRRQQGRDRRDRSRTSRRGCGNQRLPGEAAVAAESPLSLRPGTDPRSAAAALAIQSRSGRRQSPRTDRTAGPVSADPAATAGIRRAGPRRVRLACRAAACAR